MLRDAVRVVYFIADWGQYYYLLNADMS